MFILRIFTSAYLLSAPALGLDTPDEPAGAHELAWRAHRGESTFPTLTERGSEPIRRLQARGAGEGPCSTVFGFLPYWSGTSYLRYDLLTHLVCFSVEVNSDGSLGDDHGWPWTGVINDAHDSGAKVILAATLFNSADILTLIANPTYRINFFSNISAKMLEGGADGLNIDFEGGGEWRSYINGFMSDLTTYIHAEFPGSEVTIDVPPVNWGNAWNLQGLAAACDGIFIMGYNFYGSWSTTTGPNAPLTGGSVNMTDTVVNQFAPVTQNNPEKLILGVPYYGLHWKTASSAARATATAWVGSPRFSTAEPESQTYGALWDAMSQTPWYRWYDGASWHQVWFDNAASLGLKYDLAQSHDLQGVGMWALGYDDPREELWDLLADRFGGCLRQFDYDRDRDVDIADFVIFERCLFGPDVLPAPPIPLTPWRCLDVFDSDADSDVDLRDYAAFQQVFSGG